MTTAIAEKPDQADELERFSFFLRYPSETSKKGKRRPKGDTTIGAYVWTVQRLHRFLDGREVTQQAAVDFVRYLEGSNSLSSIGRHIYALQAYFNFLGQELELGAPSFTRRLPRWLNDQEWGRLLAYAEQPLFQPGATDRARQRALFHRAALFVYGG